MTYPNSQGDAAGAIPVYLTAGGQAADALTYDLLSNASVTGAPVTGVAGGSYIWNTTGTFGGATVKLQTLGPDGVTYVDVAGATTTSAAAIGVTVGNNATLKAVVTGGTPSALYSNLS